MSPQGVWSSLKLGRLLLKATRLIYGLSSVVIKPVKQLLVSKKKPLIPAELTKGSQILSAPFVVINCLDRLYLPLYYGASLLTASSFYYSAYRLVGPVINQGALACLRMAAAHPYSIGLSLILLSDLPVVLIGRGILLVLTKTGQWALRRTNLSSQN